MVHDICTYNRVATLNFVLESIPSEKYFFNPESTYIEQITVHPNPKKVVVKSLLQLKREFYVCRIYLLWNSLVVDTCNVLLFSGFYWNLESREPFSSCKGLLDQGILVPNVKSRNTKFLFCLIYPLY